MPQKTKKAKSNSNCWAKPKMAGFFVDCDKLFEICSEIVVVLDKKGKIFALNLTGHKLLGYKEGELIGKNWFKTCLPREKNEEVMNVHSKNLYGRSVERFENPVVTKKGDLKYIVWYNAPLKNDKGKIIGTLSSGKDVTKMVNKQKKYEEQLKKRADELEAINKLMIGRELKMIELKDEIEELRKSTKK